jgi:Transcriptional regulator
MPKIIDNPTAAILEASKEILLADGYDGLNMRRVAVKCNIATGTVYNYFQNKDSLIIQMMMDYWNQYFNVIDTIDNEEKDFYAKLAMIYDHFKRFTDDFHTIFLTQSFMLGYKGDAHSNRMDFMIKLQNRLAALISAKAKDAGKNIDDDEIAEFILANFVAISYVPSFTYQKFHKILFAILG